MQDPRVEMTLIKDLKPGMKNLNMIFIVLEIGQYKSYINYFKKYISDNYLLYVNTFVWLSQEDQMLPKKGMKSALAKLQIKLVPLMLQYGMNLVSYFNLEILSESVKVMHLYGRIV